jgi:Mg-chelatase subunit ChlD
MSEEFIFLVDRSGSMDGPKMIAVQSALQESLTDCFAFPSYLQLLQIMLRSLPTRGTFFNIVSFGSFQSSLWPRSLPYTGDAVAEASEHVDSMLANFGGTEMKNALQTAFSSRAAQVSEDLPTSVFVLTDGQCYDMDGVRAAIAQAMATTRSSAKSRNAFLRVFCMGIGDAVSKVRSHF